MCATCTACCLDCVHRPLLMVRQVGGRVLVVLLLLSWWMTAPLCMQHVKLWTVYRWEPPSPPLDWQLINRVKSSRNFVLLDIPFAADTSTSIQGDRNAAAEILPLSSAPLSQLKKIIDEAKFDSIDSLYWTYCDPEHNEWSWTGSFLWKCNYWFFIFYFFFLGGKQQRITFH